MYILSGILCPDGILTGAKFALRPSLAFSHTGSVAAPHSSSGRTAIMFGIGLHSSCVFFVIAKVIGHNVVCRGGSTPNYAVLALGLYIIRDRTSKTVQCVQGLMDLT